MPPTSATRTSQNAARSASRCPGAFEFCASCTIATIWASTVSEPTFVARTRSVPVVLIDAPMTVEPGALCHRQALAGHHRLVDLGVAVLDGPVDRDLRAGPDQQQVADNDIGGGNLHRFAVAQHDRHRRRQLEQRADRVVRAATGAHLEPVPQQHERRQHRGGLVEDLAAAGQRHAHGCTASPRRPRRRPAPSCPACARAGPARRRRRRSTPSRRRPAGSAAT